MSRVTAASNKPHGYKPAPNYVREWEGDYEGYLNSERFISYCLQVRDAIAEIGEAGTTMIKAHFESENDHRWLADALSHLAGVGSIKQTRGISPLRWVVKNLPAKPEKRKFMIGTPRKDVRPDAQEVFGKDAIY